MISSLFLIAAIGAPAADKPPPLNDEQVAQLRALVKTHQEEQSTLKAELELAQQKLAYCYAKFELDDVEVKKLQKQIIDLQSKLLSGYHSMQTELRTIVGPERFKILSKRIDNAVRNSEPKKSIDEKEMKK